MLLKTTGGPTPTPTPLPTAYGGKAMGSELAEVPHNHLGPPSLGPSRTVRALVAHLLLQRNPAHLLGRLHQLDQRTSMQY